MIISYRGSLFGFTIRVSPLRLKVENLFDPGPASPSGRGHALPGRARVLDRPCNLLEVLDPHAEIVAHVRERDLLAVEGI